MSRIEIAVQLLIVLGSLWIVQMDKDWEPTKFGCDFKIYYETASGIKNDGWLYKDFVAYVFKPFTIVSFPRALYFWNGLLVLSYMALVHYLLKVKYGWILSLVFFRVFTYSLVAGNVTPILCLMAIHPAASLVAILCKPYFAVFSFVHAVKDSIAQRANRKERFTDTDSPNVLFANER